MPIKVFY